MLKILSPSLGKSHYHSLGTYHVGITHAALDYVQEVQIKGSSYPVLSTTCLVSIGW